MRHTHFLYRRAQSAALALGFLFISSGWNAALLTARTMETASPPPGQLNPDKVPQESAACLKCHMQKGITGSAIRDWQLSKHFEMGVACANCHLPVKEAAPGILNASSA